MSEARFDEMAAIAKLYAKAKAEREHLEQFRKSKKALLMKAAEAAGHKTAAIQEREAYAHPEYVQLLAGLKEAIELEEGFRWQLELFKIKFETWRTQQSTKRAEMNLR